MDYDVGVVTVHGVDICEYFIDFFAIFCTINLRQNTLFCVKKICRNVWLLF